MGAPINFYSGAGVSSSTYSIVYTPFETDLSDATGNHTFVTVGTVTIDSSQSAIGIASLALNTSSLPGDYSEVNHIVTSPTGSAESQLFSLGTFDFTIDAYIRFAFVPTSSNFYGGICGRGTKYGAGSGNNWTFEFFNQFSGTDYQLVFNYKPLAAVFSPWTPSTGSWYRTTLIRSGTALTCYVNAVQLGSVYNIGTTNLGTAEQSWRFWIGGEDSVNGSAGNVDSFPGWIDYVLINREFAEIPSKPINFYSRPESLLETSVLYLGMDTGFNDYTGNHTVTTHGTISISTGSYAAGGGSGSFTSADTSYLEIPDSDDFTILYADDVTIDCHFFGNISVIGSNVLVQFAHLKDGFGRNPHQFITFSYNTSVSRFQWNFAYGNTFGSNAGANLFFPAGFTVTSTDFHRITSVKDGSIFSVYFDNNFIGNTLVSAADVFGNLYLENINSPVLIGYASGNPVLEFGGLIDEWSFTRTVRIPGGQPTNFYSLP